ncbi:ankyrin repeat domain-containing protein, partial [Nonomuraea sp. NN258]|nr:ankyrin repeat domain-containing protein [Nonomuraea antri]
LFPLPDGEAGLSPAESTAATEAKRLISVLGNLGYDGFSLACVPALTAAEAANRLNGTPADAIHVAAIMDDPLTHFDDNPGIIGLTDVPGGCVVFQSWGFLAYTPGILKHLSAGTVCHAMFANPMGGNRGAVARDGVLENSDTHPAAAKSTATNPPPKSSPPTSTTTSP